MQLPSKTLIWTHVSAFVAGAIFVLILMLKGCFGGATFTKPFPNDSVLYSPDTVLIEVPAKPLTLYAKEIITKWRTDTLWVDNGTEAVPDALEFDTTFTINRSVTVKQGKESHLFSDSTEVSLRAIIDCMLGRSLFSVSPLAYQSIEIPERPSISKGTSFFTLRPYFEFDLVNEKAWKVGARFYVNLDPLGIYISPNANPEHALSLPVGIDYKVWEK